MNVASAVASEGQIWICGACGRIERDRYRFRDASCFLNSALVYDNKPADVSPFDHQWTAVKEQS